jgi:hypothetical protein
MLQSVGQKRWIFDGICSKEHADFTIQRIDSTASIMHAFIIDLMLTVLAFAEEIMASNSASVARVAVDQKTINTATFK